MDGRFLKFPGKKEESKALIRRKEGFSEEKFENILTDWEKRAMGREAHPSFKKIIRKYEVEKTPEQEEVIRAVLEKLDELLEKYEAKKQDFAVSDVLIEKDAFWKEIGLNDAGGASSPYFDKVFFRESNSKTNTRLASAVCHEFIHQSGFVRGLLAEGGKDGFAKFKSERGGLYVKSFDEKETYLHNLNEAITTELERRLMQEMKEHPLFKRDFWMIKKEVSREEEKEASALTEFEDVYGETRYSTHTAYPKQRERMQQVFEEIYQKHQEEFESSEEVFDVFAKAYFNGRLLEVSRLLKETYGKDKTIKEIAEEQGL